MGIALYRKYRSRSFDEVVGQDHITQTLKNAIKSQKISHAYLFTGPKGVGKTSVARILAHEVNNLSYNDDSIHLDIIEIDAASNRRIDEIRDLRERVHIAPTSAKYKVYIIDEVHMLTREAFNALLKTLEEPPKHVIFVLATTEAHKLPETIVSRTQRFSFKPLGRSQTVSHLASIAKKEKIKIEPQALELLANHGQGSFRDSIGLLDQLSGRSEVVTPEIVRELLGLPPAQLIEKLMEQITAGASAELLATLEELWEYGANPAIVTRDLATALRTKLLVRVSGDWLTTLLKELVEVPASSSPRDFLEISLMEAAAKNQSSHPRPTNAATAVAAVSHPSSAPKPKPQPSHKKSQKSHQESASLPHRPGEAFGEKQWAAVVDLARREAASLYTALRLSIPRFDGDALTLMFEFPLHQKKVTQAKNLQRLGKLVEDVSGSKLTIKCVVDKAQFPQKKPSPQLAEAAERENGVHKAISNIFGSAEVLES